MTALADRDSMWNLTLDHNCLINLENNSGQSAALRQLIALHRRGAIRVHVGMMSASENVRAGEPTYGAFRQRIARLGLSELPQVASEGRIDMSYVDANVIGSLRRRQRVGAIFFLGHIGQ